MDRQSSVYRYATEADWAGVDPSVADVYPDGDPRPLRSPEEHEAARWDTGRDLPKSLAQARAALQRRIDDPRAPDDESVDGAYDDLEG